MLKSAVGLMIGLTMGSTIPLVTINTEIAAVVLIVSIDALIGSLLASLKSSFNDIEMISGFIVNLATAILLVWLGDYLILNLYYLALFAVGIRIFKNLSKIRQHVIKKL